MAYARNVSHPPAAAPHPHAQLQAAPLAGPHAQQFAHQQQQHAPQQQQQQLLRAGTLKHVASSTRRAGGGGGAPGGGPGAQLVRPNSTGDTFDADADSVSVGLDGRVHFYRSAPFQVIASPPPQYAQPQQFGYPPSYSNNSGNNHHHHHQSNS